MSGEGVTFELDAEQVKKLNDWITVQRQKNDGYCGAIGGRFIYSFIPTSIGTVAKVQDYLTNDEIDLSDYDSW